MRSMAELSRWRESSTWGTLPMEWQACDGSEETMKVRVLLRMVGAERHLRRSLFLLQSINNERRRHSLANGKISGYGIKAQYHLGICPRGSRAESDLASSSRWKALKKLLVAEQTKLGDYADVKQFYRDLEDLEEWIGEMLPTACDESYKDPTNIQASSKWESWKTLASPDFWMQGISLTLNSS